MPWQLLLRSCPQWSSRAELQQRRHMGTCSSVSGLCTEGFTSGFAQFVIQGGRKQPELDVFLLMRILKVA